MLATRLRRAALAIGLLAPLAAQAGPFSTIFVFGDSLSDGGSDFNISSSIHALNPAFPVVPGAAGDYFGRFGNGKVAVDYLADRLGLPLTAHYTSAPFLPGPPGGRNYAQGGATSGLENASLPGTIPGPGGTTLPTGFKGVTGEIADYKATTSVADPNALYVVWGGANDFLHPGATAILPSCAMSSSPAVCTGVTNIANAVSALAAMGAKHILVPNLPDLGETAGAIAAGAGAVAAGHAASVGFDAGLASALAALTGLYPGTIVPFDLFTAFDDIVAHASDYGFSNTTKSCLTGSSADATSVPTAACLAAGVNSYLFWDDVHPTTAAQLLLAQRFAAVLGAPEPSDIALVGLGLIVLIAARRRTRKL